MAEETHFKDLQEFHKKLDQFQQIEIMKRAAIELKIQKQFAGIDKKFDHVTNTLAEIKLQLLNLGKVSGSSDNSVLGCYDLSSGVDKSGNYVHTPLPRFDFPRFDGSNPRAWFLRCSTYFQLMPNIPDVQKIILATKHFDGKALMWHQNFNMGEIEITWEQFLEVVSARFEDVKVTNIFMELNKLKQNDGTYDDYVESFEELRACLMLNDSNKSYEDYFIASFLSGLSEELRSFINMFQPRTLHQAIELGKRQIITLDAISKKLQQPDAQFSSSLASYGREEPAPQGILKPNHIPEPSTKLLLAAELSAQIDKELCSNCDEPYVFGHKCHTNMVQTVTEVHELWKLINAQEVADLENPDTGWRDSGQPDETFVLQDTNKKGDIPLELIPKLEKYAAIFEEQVGLPLARGVEHQIQLKPAIIPKQHLTEVLQLLQKYPLFGKSIKCSFNTGRVEYFGHIIIVAGATNDLENIAWMVAWPIPKHVKQFRRFLRLFQALYGYLPPHPFVGSYLDSPTSDYNQHINIIKEVYALLTETEEAVQQHTDGAIAKLCVYLSHYLLGLALCRIQENKEIQNREIEESRVFKVETKRVKLQALTTVVEGKGNSGPVLISLIHEEMTNFHYIFVKKIDALLAKSTLMLEFFLGRSSDISNPSEKRAETQLGVGDMICLKFKILHQYSILGIGKEFVPVLKPLEDDDAGASMLRARITTGRINAVFQSFADGIQSGLMYIETASAPLIRCKKDIIVQKWPEAADNRDFKIEPLLILNTHRANRRSQEIPQIPAPWLKLVLQFAIWEGSLHIIQGSSAAGESGALCKKRVKDELYLAIEIDSTVEDLMVEEGPKHEPVQKLLEMDGGGDYKIERVAAVGLCLFTKKGEHTSEFDSDGHSKIEPIMPLGTRILTRKGEMVAQILVHWLKARSEFVTLEVEEFLRRKFPPFDPCGQGSSSGGGIVMYCGELNENRKKGKKKRMNRELGFAAKLGKKTDSNEEGKSDLGR